MLDNAGGHGSNEAVEKYTEDLKNKYKIEIIQQVPRSPETNVLDLGIWMSLQSAVEKEHRGQKNDANALDKTVMKVWANVAEAFLNVFGKLPVICNNIKRSRGGNNLVETRRGKRLVSQKLPRKKLKRMVNHSGQLMLPAKMMTLRTT